MSLRLKNTYTKTIETFAPRDPAGKRVLLYSCGPTVYSYAHIGNFRTFLLSDVLARVLRRRGYDVRHVMNITDVGHMTQDHLADATGEDKLSRAARELGWDPYQVAEHFIAAFESDARALKLANMLPPYDRDAGLHPRATRHVPEMLAMIAALMKRGYAYVDDVGQVYFEIAKFPEYGQLSGKVIDELEAGARVEVRQGKRDARDFALWKVDDKHLMQWDPHAAQGWPAEDWQRYRALVPDGVDARIGRGFPGWHLECSAMVRAQLGDEIDIHTGGEDNIFPHHECEIAQTAGAIGVLPFSRYWVHGRHLLVDNRKMSKSEGTFFTARDFLDPGKENRPDLSKNLIAIGFPSGRVPAEVLRLALISSPFTYPMNFTFELLGQARTHQARIQSLYDRLREVEHEATSADEDALAAAAERSRASFDAALDDNLDTASALAALLDFVSYANSAAPTGAAARRARELLEEADAIFSIIDARVRSGLVEKARLDELAQRPAAAETEGTDAVTIELFIGARHAAKKARDFAAADALRETLRARGVLIEDTPKGVRWKLA